MTTQELPYAIVDTLEDKKGEDILLLDLRGVTELCDYFVICTGTSDRMLDGLADDLVRKIRTSHQVKGQLEGRARDGWLLVDYGDVIVHLFSPDQRDYYALEELWEGSKPLVHIQ
ncbi:MAG: ribosome silencing factor [Anaerolineae bacterium]|nr:ribosome silencing factor [Anaerolineae bacterium]MBT7072210.1 ribosome silencing factor [Anaerolineae bacterium]MBT7323958.1 ribosome silencing factor [Anaerolineae bacterium]